MQKRLKIGLGSVLEPCRALTPVDAFSDAAPCIRMHPSAQRKRSARLKPHQLKPNATIDATSRYVRYRRRILRARYKPCANNWLRLKCDFYAALCVPSPIGNKLLKEAF